MELNSISTKAVFPGRCRWGSPVCSVPAEGRLRRAALLPERPSVVLAALLLVQDLSCQLNIALCRAT